NDLWEWNGANWVPVSPGGRIAPSARAFAAMSYDSRIARIVLFGGLGAGAAPLRDTWLWDGTSWQNVPTNGPTARFNHAMAYDSARGRTVLYGRGTNANTEPRRLWEF